MKLYLPFNGRVKVTSTFGNRTLNGAADYHKGVDLVALDDITLRAPCDGVIGSSTIITDKTNLTWQWGNYIRLDTADGLFVFMCHLASRAVEAGQRVKKGDVLGVMGNTGYSFGAHTHFEVRNAKGESLNPAQFLGIENKAGVYQNPQSVPAGVVIPDEDEQSSWSKEEGWWDKAKARGIVDGTNPRGNLTREQCIAVLGRLGLI